MMRSRDARRSRFRRAAQRRALFGGSALLALLVAWPAQAKNHTHRGGESAAKYSRGEAPLNLAPRKGEAKRGGDKAVRKAVATANIPQPGSGSASAFARWLSRPVGMHPELLNHGEVAALFDLGVPYGYRLGVKVGILDVLTLGVLAQWRDPKLGLRWAPELGIAAYRGEHLSLGLRYRYLFHKSPAPLPEPDPQAPKEAPEEESSEAEDAKALPEPAFFRRTHYLAGSLVWSSGYISAGLEAGATYRRELDQSQTILDPHLFSMQWRPMTGVLLRFGDERWGVSFQAMIPSPEVTLRVEWRHALFSVVKRRDPLSRALQRAKARDQRLSQGQR